MRGGCPPWCGIKDLSVYAGEKQVPLAEMTVRRFVIDPTAGPQILISPTHTKNTVSINKEGNNIHHVVRGHTDRFLVGVLAPWDRGTRYWMTRPHMARASR